MVALAMVASAAAQNRNWASVTTLMEPWLKGDFASGALGYEQFANGGYMPVRYRVDMELELANYRFCSQLLKRDGEWSSTGWQMRRARLLYLTGDIVGADHILQSKHLQYSDRMALHLMNTRGMIALARGNFAEANQEFHKYLRVPRKLTEKIDEPETILALNGLTQAEVPLGHLNAAEEYGTRALRLAQLSWGQFSIPALDSMQALAEVRLAQHRMDDARKLIEDCARERKKLYGKNPKVADIWELGARYNLASGSAEAALNQAGGAMDMRQEIFGGPSLWSAEALLTKGDVYAAIGALDQASRCYDNGVPVLESALGADAPSVQKARQRRDAIHAQMASATP